MAGQHDDAFILFQRRVQPFRMLQRNILGNIIFIQLRSVENFHQRLAQILKQSVHDLFRCAPIAFHASHNVENSALVLFFQSLSYNRA